MSSTSSVGLYPSSIISFAVFIKFLNTDFSNIDSISDFKDALIELKDAGKITED